MRASMTPRHASRSSLALNVQQSPGGWAERYSTMHMMSPSRPSTASTLTRIAQSPSDLTASFNDAAAAGSTGAGAGGASANGRDRGENIQVHIRIRPSVDGHQTESSKAGDCVVADPGGKSVSFLPSMVRATSQRMQFDHVFDANTSQADLSAVVAPRFVDSCLKGFNGTILAYGQTGSGKTYSMTGPSSELMDSSSANRGLIPRLLESLFTEMDTRERAGDSEVGADRVKFSVQVEFVEIYNECLRDLLSTSPNPPPLDIRTLPNLHVSNLTRVTLASYAEACKLLVAGNKTRTFASTRMNEQSSRSHSVFTLHITTTYVDSTKTTTARLNLVDLAGSENQKSAGTTGDRLKEGANINKSLSTLSQVIAALSKKSVHIPFRNSKLTFLLSDSIGGNSKTSLIATISPSADHAADTLNTLTFANTAKSIKLDVVQNLQVNGKSIDAVALQKRLESVVADNQRLKAAQAGHEESLAAVRSLSAAEGDALYELLDQCRAGLAHHAQAAECWARTDAEARAVVAELEDLAAEEGAQALARESALQVLLQSAREQVSELESAASLTEEQAGRKVHALLAQVREVRASQEAAVARAETAEARADALELRVAALEAEKALQAHESAAQLLQNQQAAAKAAEEAAAALQVLAAKHALLERSYHVVRGELAAQLETNSNWAGEVRRLTEERSRLLEERSSLGENSAKWHRAGRAHQQGLQHRLAAARDAQEQWGAAKQRTMCSAPLWAQEELAREDGENDAAGEELVALVGDGAEASLDVLESDAHFRAMLADLCSQPLDPRVASPLRQGKRASNSNSTSAAVHPHPLQDRAMNAQGQAQLTPQGKAQRSALGEFLDSASKQRQRNSLARQGSSPASGEDTWSLVLDPVARQMETDAARRRPASMQPHASPAVAAAKQVAHARASSTLESSTPSRLFR